MPMPAKIFCFGYSNQQLRFPPSLQYSQKHSYAVPFHFLTSSSTGLGTQEYQLVG